ncbi:MAG: hypothetical protein NTU78_19775 [Alphaproteobacteria bacterium]|jgi:hypothetical protein|nr:hypothetical protein [Alphaproteobacteria bacterium]
MRFIQLALIVIGLAIAPLQAQAWGLISPSESTMAFSAMQNAGRTADKVRTIKKVPSVGILSLRVPIMFGGTSYPEYQIFASRNAAGISKLRRALSANPVTRQALAKRGIPVGIIAGVRVSSNGSLRIYVLD